MLAIASQLPSPPMTVYAPVTPTSAVRRVTSGGCGCGGGCDCAAKSRAAAPPGDRVELSDAAREASRAAAGEASTGQRTPSQEEQTQIAKLKARDAEVRAHEQAHLAAAGGLAIGGPSYELQRGPDGQPYAVGGEVQIDTSPVGGDSEATIRKMTQVIAAALAPAEPSGADRAVAAAAQAARAQAQTELLQQRADELRSPVDPEAESAANAGQRPFNETDTDDRQSVRERQHDPYARGQREPAVGQQFDLAA